MLSMTNRIVMMLSRGIAGVEMREGYRFSLFVNNMYKMEKKLTQKNNKTLKFQTMETQVI